MGDILTVKSDLTEFNPGVPGFDHDLFDNESSIGVDIDPRLDVPQQVDYLLRVADDSDSILEVAGSAGHLTVSATGVTA